LFYIRCVYLLDFFSFPTRRSSDLFMFDYDISSLELLGIKFRRGLYGDLIDFESSIEKLYNSFEKQSLLNSEMSFFSRKEKIISRSEEHTSELQSRFDLVCRLLLEK